MCIRDSDTLSTIGSVLQAPATMGKYGVQSMEQAKQEGKSPIGGLLKGYGTGLGKAITNQDMVENIEVLEGIAPKTTSALKEKYPNAYKAVSTIINLFGVDDLTAIGLLGDIAKVRKLNKGINTTTDLVRMSQAGIKDADKVARLMQNPDIAKAVDDIPQKELDNILYVDPYGNVRKTPKTDLMLEAPKTDLTTPKILQREAPYTITKSDLPKTSVEPPKVSGGINTPPIEKKSLTGAIKASDEVVATAAKETDRIKQAHSNIRNLKKNLEVASNPDEVKALKKQLAAERKTVHEYNKANRQTIVSKVQDLIKNSDKWKDKKGLTGTLRLQRETWDRNIIDIAGKDGKKIKEVIFDKIHVNEAASTRFKNKSRAIVKNLKLSKKESEIVQKVGEGVMSITEIPQGMNAQKIQKSVDALRKWYDEVINIANDVLVKNGYEPIGKLENYFPHFNDEDPIFKMLKEFGVKLDDMELPTDINGITHTFRPGKQWFGHFLHRTGDKTAYDAVAGFDRYVEGISNVIYHTDDVKTLRTLVDELRLKYSSAEIIKRVGEIGNEPT